MLSDFFSQPILNSPYEYSGRHWELDDDDEPTNRILKALRRSALVARVPKVRKQRRCGGRGQAKMVLDEGAGLSSEEQEYEGQQESQEGE